MPQHLTRRIILILLLVGGFINGHAADSRSTEMAEADILAFLDDPAALPAAPVEPSASVPEAVPDARMTYLFSASARVGVGHSSNFLKQKNNPETSNYTQLEVDAFASWGNSSREFNALAFVEATLYDSEFEPSDEIMAFLQVTGNLAFDTFDLGFEASLVYGSFIYDASITTVTVTSGTEIEQLLPSAKIYADWYATGSDRIRLSLAAGYSDFNLENQDYWNPALNLELKHVWTREFLTTSQIDLSRQVYDDDLARDPVSDPIDPETGLVVNRLGLNQRFEWKPDFVKWLKMDMSAGLAWEDEDEGQYEAMRQSWISGKISINNYWGRFQFSGKWGEYRYDQRWVSRWDDRLNLQTNRTLTVEYSRSLPWRLGLKLRNQWNSLSSRVYQDSYSERRSEILLEWYY